MSELFEPDPATQEADSARLSAKGAELARALSGPASRLVAEMRLEQILKHGHDGDTDAMQPIDHLPRLAQVRLIRAMDHIRGTAERRNLAVARRDLARVAAMCMAGIDRLDLAMKAVDE